jgi:hypothetical protein
LEVERVAWQDIATEPALDRCERLVIAGLGTLTNDDSNVLGDEIRLVLNELAGDGDEYTRLLGCVTAIASMAIHNISLAPLPPEEQVDPTVEQEAARRNAELQTVANLIDVLRDLRTGNL